MAILTLSHGNPNSLGTEGLKYVNVFCLSIYFLYLYTLFGFSFHYILSVCTVTLHEPSAEGTNLTVDHKEMKSYQTILQKACVVSLGPPFVTMHIPKKRAQTTTQILTAMMKLLWTLVPDFSRGCVYVCVVRVYIEDCLTRNNLKTIGLSCGPVEKWFAGHFTWTAWHLSYQRGWILQPEFRTSAEGSENWKNPLTI